MLLVFIEQKVRKWLFGAVPILRNNPGFCELLLGIVVERIEERIL